MSDQALRQVFAELGFNVDDKALTKLNAVVDLAIGKVRALAVSTGLVDHAEQLAAARETARAAAKHKQSVQAVEDAKKASGGSAAPNEAGLFGALRAAATEQAAAKEKARKDELALAHGAAARAALGQAPQQTSDPFGRSSKTDPKALGFGGKFGATQWKKTEEAAKAVADRIEKATKGPIESIQGMLARADAVAANTLGKAMPASVKKFSEKLGIAKGDALSLGQTILSVSRKGAVGLAALVVGVVAFTTAFAAEAEALRETAREARVTSTQLQELQYAGMASGVGADRMTASVTALGQKLRDVNNHVAGSGGTVGHLRRLGIAARDASGNARPTIDVMMDLGSALEHVSSRRRRSEIAGWFGLDPRMLDVLHSGAGGLRELIAEAREYGEGVTPEATEAARRFTVAQGKLQRGLTSLRSSIFSQLSPSMEGLMEKAGKLAGWFSRVTRGTQVFSNAARILGVGLAVAAVPALIAWAPMLATFLGIAGAVTLSAAALDDMQGFLAGNNSLFGDLIDRFTDFIGIGPQSANIVRGINTAWDQAGNAIARFFDWIDRLPPALQAVLAPLRALGYVFRGTGDDSAPRAGAQGAPPPPPETPAQAAARQRSERNTARNPPPPPTQIGFNGEVIEPGPAGGRQARVSPAAATRAVTAPGSAGGNSTTTTTTVQGDRNTFHIASNDVAGMRREVERLMDERERRRNAERSPREPQG